MSYETKITVNVSPDVRKNLDYIRGHVPEMENEKDGNILRYVLNECSRMEGEKSVEVDGNMKGFYKDRVCNMMDNLSEHEARKIYEFVKSYTEKMERSEK